MRITVNYDPATGNITDDVGVNVFTLPGIEMYTWNEKGETKSGTDIQKLKELHSAGFSAQDIIAMNEAGLV